MSDFYKRLLSLKNRGEKNKEFAARIGASVQALNYWKGGNIPSREKLEQISRVTGVSIDWLIGGFQRVGQNQGEDSEKVRLLGAKTTRPMNDQARLHMALGWLSELDLGKEERDKLAELVQALAQDPDLLTILHHHFAFLRWQKEHEKKGPPK